MSMDHWDKRTAQTARERLAQVRAATKELAQALHSDLTAAASYTHPDLSPQGVDAKRQELQAAVRAKHAATLDTLRATVAANTAAIAAITSKVRPSLANDVAGMTRAQIKWDQVRARLEAGTAIGKIIADGDAETLVAVAEWGPSWLLAQAEAATPAGLAAIDHPPANPAPAVRNAIDERLMTIGDADTQWAIQADREARQLAAWFDQSAGHIERLATGAHSDPLHAAVAAHYAEADAVAAL